MIRVQSPAFQPDERIPDRHARDGDDRSPALQWDGVPPGTAELAVICDDPDAPMDKPFVHWVLYGVPADTEGLDEGSALGTPGTNDWGEPGYGGPQPPVGHGTHHYHFHVYALDQPVELDAGATKDELLGAMREHVLDEGEIVGTYER